MICKHNWHPSSAHPFPSYQCTRCGALLQVPKEQKDVNNDPVVPQVQQPRS